MGALIRLLAAVAALAMSTGSALVTMGKTTTDVALRTGPTAQAEIILNLSQGTLVNVGRCSRGWCSVTSRPAFAAAGQRLVLIRPTVASGLPSANAAIDSGVRSRVSSCSRRMGNR